eukprot:TRINITY_DN40110_c0_g1_i1.p1 TRINITY_DN40110_c0_g1~~TRINITY_DN40110_c0_g1_i1.p1  ORF type:complete len:187 (+),score=41.09 TRINITY_DN40110_c0_g1_i1:40-600(+)
MAGTTDKIFVGGLPQGCSDEMFTDYFAQYGTITDSVVMKDRATGNTRGFGFITYDNTDSVDTVMDLYKDHKINDKWIEVKRAQPKGQAPPARGGKGGGMMMGGKSGGGKGCGYGAPAPSPYGGAPYGCGYGAPGGYGAYGGYGGGYPAYPQQSPYGAAPAYGGYGGYGAAGKGYSVAPPAKGMAPY